MPDEKSAGATPKRQAFDFYYEKTGNYRTIHADGFIVSPNAKGQIAITFYSERLAIPRHVELTFDENDEATEKVIDGKSGVIRSIDLTAFIDSEAAEELREWLAKAIDALGKHEDTEE